MMIYQDFSSQMKKYVRVLAFLLLAGLTASSFAFAIYYLVSAQEMKGSHVSPQQIAVSGEGKVAAKPDIATVSASVVTQAPKVGDAQAQNSARSNKVMDFLKSNGVAEKDIKTVGYAITPQYEYGSPCPIVLGAPYARCPSGTPRIASYEVRHTIEVKIRDLAKADVVLEGVVSAGANEVSGLQFGIDDSAAVKAAARKQAIDDAEKKAEVLAQDLGIRLKRIVSFSDSGEGGPIYPYALKADMGGMTSAPSAPQVAPGEQEVRSNVTITYEFR